MNALVVGTDTSPILDLIPDRDYLLIDDGSTIDTLTNRAKVFDVRQHSFNPLSDMTYIRAREFVSVLDAVFPEGENTLTRRYSNFHILSELLQKPRRLDNFITRSKETEDAWQKIQTLLLSPVLDRVLNNRTTMSLTGTIHVRLSRAELGDFDCFVIGNLLMSAYKGQIVVPDFSFYAAKHHNALIHQNRLIAGVRYLEDVPKLKSALLTIEEKIPSKTNAEDAETLAIYCSGFPKGTDGFSTYVTKAMA